MATKTKDENVKTTENPQSTVHHMVRPLGAVSREITTELGDVVFPVDRVNADVQNWLDAGYKLLSTHYLGEIKNTGLGSPTIGYRILYIFIKQ